MTISVPSISVVIPTCDRIDYLNQALKSVVEQSSSANEIIIIDNGVNPVNDVDLTYSDNVRLIRALPRFGVAQARNLGAILAKSEYISFLDDDDEWDSGYLGAVRSTMLETSAPVVLGQLKYMDTGLPIAGKQVGLLDGIGLIDQIMKRNPGVVGSNTTVLRSIFNNTTGYDPFLTTGEDKGLVLDLLLSGSKVCRADKAWVMYRDNGLGPRESQKIFKGKIRFLMKYWSKMSVRAKIINVMKITKLAFVFKK